MFYNQAECNETSYDDTKDWFAQSLSICQFDIRSYDSEMRSKLEKFELL